MGSPRLDTCVHLDSNIMMSPIGGYKSTANLVLYTFTWFDVIVVLVSMATYIADIITDILVTILYWKINEVIWAILTIFFLIFPSIIMQIFSTRWFLSDGRKITIPLLLVHIFMMGPILRYVNVLKHGMRAKKSKRIEDYQKTYSDLSDASMLRLIESFLESAPQLVLQLYIILEFDANDHVLTSISAFFSLISLSWAIAAYTKALRMAVFHTKSGIKKRKVSWTGLFIQTTWRVGMVASRLCALVLFATVHPYWLLGVVLTHWLAMTIWQIVQDTDFCSTVWEERLFNTVIGFVHIFCFMNMKEGKSRYRMIPYYALMLIENSVMIIIWWTDHQPEIWYEYYGMAIVWGGFLIGLLSMFLYHQFFHPSSEKHCHCCMLYYHFLYKCCPCYNITVAFDQKSQNKNSNNIYSNFDTTCSPSDSISNSEHSAENMKALIMPKPNATSTPADFLDEESKSFHQSLEELNEVRKDDTNGGVNTLVRNWVKKAQNMHQKTKGVGLNGTLLLNTPQQNLNDSRQSRECEIISEFSTANALIDTDNVKVQHKQVEQMKRQRKCDSRESFRKVFGFQNQLEQVKEPMHARKRIKTENLIKARIDQKYIPPSAVQSDLNVIKEESNVEDDRNIHKKSHKLPSVQQQLVDKKPATKLVWKQPKNNASRAMNKPGISENLPMNAVFAIPTNVPQQMLSPYDNVQNEEDKNNGTDKENKRLKPKSTTVSISKKRLPLGAKVMNTENVNPETSHKYAPVQSDRVDYLYKLGRNAFKKKCLESPARRQLSYNSSMGEMTKSIEGLTEDADVALQNSTSYRVHLS